MLIFIIALIVIVGILLGLVILVQNPKGEGLATGFQGAHQIGGVQRTTDFLEKATWYLAIALMVLSLVASKFSKTTGSGLADDELGDDLIEQPATSAQDNLMNEDAATFDNPPAQEEPAGGE